MGFIILNCYTWKVQYKIVLSVINDEKILIKMYLAIFSYETKSTNTIFGIEGGFERKSRLMLINFLSFCIFYIFFLTAQPLHAQEGIVSIGGTKVNTSGSISYSVGQIDYKYTSTSDGKINAGIQQPFEIYTISIDEIYKNISIEVFPNPTDLNLNLIIDSDDVQKFRFTIIGVTGIENSKHSIFERTTSINMGNLISGTYFINIFDSNNFVKSFKIIKN